MPLEAILLPDIIRLLTLSVPVTGLDHLQSSDSICCIIGFGFRQFDRQWNTGARQHLLLQHVPTPFRRHYGSG